MQILEIVIILVMLKKQTFSIFSKATFDINEKLSGYLDLQGRFVNYQTKGLPLTETLLDVDANFNFFNPKVGLTYKIDDQNSIYLLMLEQIENLIEMILKMVLLHRNFK